MLFGCAVLIQRPFRISAFVFDSCFIQHEKSPLPAKILRMSFIYSPYYTKNSSLFSLVVFMNVNHMFWKMDVYAFQKKARYDPPLLYYTTAKEYVNIRRIWLISASYVITEV